MATTQLSLVDLLQIAADIDVVDVGANPIDGDRPYRPLMSNGIARVVGFEPNEEALDRLLQQRGPHETYLPHAIGDGKRHTLHICRAEGMNSLLRPNDELLKLFHGFPQWGEIVRTREIDTVRLDEIEAPTLILHGRRDRGVKPAAALATRVGIRDSEIEFFRGGHMFFMLTQRNEVAARIEDFLQDWRDRRWPSSLAQI